MTGPRVVLAVDPGLASTGFVVAEFDPKQLRPLPASQAWRGVRPLAAGLIRTKPEGKGKGLVRVRQCDVLAERVAEIGRHLDHVLTHYLPGEGAYVAYEAYTPGRPQKFRRKVVPGTLVGEEGEGTFFPGGTAALSTLSVTGGVVLLAVLHGLPLLVVHPSESKKFFAGPAGGAASKAQVYATRGRELEAVRLDGYRWPPGENEHVGDAYAVAVATAWRVASSPALA